MGVEVVQLTEEQRGLVERNTPLARFLAHNRWLMAPSSLDYEELVSLANQGLVSAAQRWRSYSEEKGLPEDEIATGAGFSIFSRKRIIGAILDWQKRDADHVSRYYRTDYKILQRAGYPDRVRKHDELSELTGLDVERIRAVITAVELKPVSFDAIVSTDSDDWTPSYDEPVSRLDTEGSVLVAAISESVAVTVSRLPDLQQVVLALRYFEHLELQAIAVELGSSITAVREAHNAALLAVHSAMVDAAAS